MWRKKFPALPTWKQKTKRPVRKRFRSKLAPELNKNRKIEETLMCSSPVCRVRFVSISEDNDPDEEEKVAGSGQTLSTLELVSIVMVRSPTKSREEEGVDLGAFRDLQELLDEPTPSWSKVSVNISSSSKPALSMSSGKRTKRESRIGDLRVYFYDEITESQEKLNDSDEFHFYLDDVEKEF